MFCPGRTLNDHFISTGTAGQISLVVFLTAVVIALVIQTKRLGLHPRLALFPISLMPLLVGVCGTALNLGHIFDVLARRDLPSVGTPMDDYLIILKATVVGAGETTVLLFICALLLALHREEPPGKVSMKSGNPS